MLTRGRVVRLAKEAGMDARDYLDKMMAEYTDIELGDLIHLSPSYLKQVRSRYKLPPQPIRGRNRFLVEAIRTKRPLADVLVDTVKKHGSARNACKKLHCNYNTLAYAAMVAGISIDSRELILLRGVYTEPTLALEVIREEFPGGPCRGTMASRASREGVSLAYIFVKWMASLGVDAQVVSGLGLPVDAIRRKRDIGV